MVLFSVNVCYWWWWWLWAASGTFVVTQQWNLEDHTARMTPLLPSSPTLEPWTTSNHLVQNPEVWGTTGGRAHGSHLLLAILCQFYPHMSFLSALGVVPPDRSELAIFLLRLCDRANSASEMRGYELRIQRITTTGWDRCCNDKWINLCFWKIEICTLCNPPLMGEMFSQVLKGSCI